MRIRIQVIVEKDEQADHVDEIACFERNVFSSETLGMTLAEGRVLLANVHETMVQRQAEEAILAASRCARCGRQHKLKETKGMEFHSLFGKMTLASPRFYSCPCQPSEQGSFSPLAEKLSERTAPELLYLESKWSALISYGLSLKLLDEILPLEVSMGSLYRNTQRIAKRLEDELDEEQWCFIDGCERDWEKLPDPGPPIAVGIDGGYVRARSEETRKAGSFEIIVGKCMGDNGSAKRFGFVHGHDQKPKRRLFETMKAQGFQINQDVLFLSDGGETVRNLQQYMSPNAEHVLDWFHITMRITVIKQMIKGLAEKPEIQKMEPDADRLKWFLWHGNVFRALQLIEDMEDVAQCLQYNGDGNKTKPDKKLAKLARTLHEMNVYISSNRHFIPNYGDRHHYGEPISTAFVESTVNEVINRRMSKKQQMRWSKRGAHLLLQVRNQALNGDLRTTFQRWYPGMPPPTEAGMSSAA